MWSLELISLVFSIFCATIGAIYVLMAKVFKFGRVLEKLDGIEQNVAYLKERVSEHHEDIAKIKTILISKYNVAFSIFSMKSSPRKLNANGEKLFNAANGESFLNENKDALFKFIKDSKPLAALDVEAAALAACQSFVPLPAFTPFKEFVYNESSWTLENGNKYDITISDICFVLSLRLRDMYLKEIGV